MNPAGKPSEDGYTTRIIPVFVSFKILTLLFKVLDTAE
jgi:hypothetical protein